MQKIQEQVVVIKLLAPVDCRDRTFEDGSEITDVMVASCSKPEDHKLSG